MTPTPADVIANELRVWSGPKSRSIGFGHRAESIIAALAAAGYRITAEPPRCPTCGSDDPAHHKLWCHDAWHTTGGER